MAESPWTALTSVERALIICASEAWGILPYAEADLDEEDDAADLPGAVLGLVDRGWVRLHRLEPWSSPDGRRGAVYGPPIPGAEIAAVVGDPATWEEPEDSRWIGAVTLSLTDVWRTLGTG